jgi:hypothetical protein
MMVYHVCSLKKLNKYITKGHIKAPVRAWITIKEAERFMKQTSRPIVLRLRFPNDCLPLVGHRGKAVMLPYHFELPKELASNGVK